MTPSAQASSRLGKRIFLAANPALIAQRLAQAALTLLAVIIVSFVLIRLAPGDPALLLAGDSGANDAAFVEEIRRDLGLDQPIAVQLFRYLKAVLSLDFGLSYRDRQPVLDIVLERVPATLLLTTCAFILSLLAGIGLGALAARRPGSWLDSGITALSVMFFAMPMFWIGLMLIIIFAVNLGWLPSYGMLDPGVHGFWPSLRDLLAHMTLPVLTLGLYYMSIQARVSRAALRQVSGKEFIRTARAKGMAPSLIWRDHLLRNALLPILTIAALQAGHLIGGSVLVETVFAWPGMGRLAFDALMARDYNVLLAVFMLSSLGVIVVNLLADIAYQLIDPRVNLRAGA